MERIEAKKYTLEITEYADGHTTVNANNVGFSCIELIGWIRHKENDLLKQLDGSFNGTSEVRQGTRNGHKFVITTEPMDEVSDGTRKN